MWLFYVNRGQAVASFGIENKDNPIMEFRPANTAYQATPYTGFRTFLKLGGGAGPVLYEPFSPWSADDSSQMFVGMNELELETESAEYGVQTNVLYFTLPGEGFAALVRQLTVRNIGEEPTELEVLDGMAAVVPYGVTNWQLKHIGRTIEAWMEVFNLERGIPFYRLRASAQDSPEVEQVEAGHFYLAFTADNDQPQLLPAFVDPAVVFGKNSALNSPDQFERRSLAELQSEHQIAVGRTPCGLFGTSAVLEPTEELTIHAMIGHVVDLGQLQREKNRIVSADYLCQKRYEAQMLARKLTDMVDTRTGSSTFDAYCRQTFLDNALRGGWPLILGNGERPVVYHVYSRKHGDLERDYNDFRLAAEMFSQGNGNYRDMNQNWRCDVLLNPRVGDFGVLAFLGLIQADGYNPLVVNGSRFTVSPEDRVPIMALVEKPNKLESTLAQPFTPGQLLSTIIQQEIGLTVGAEEFISTALTYAVQHSDATHGEGYWIDHWTYNLDLIDAYLAVYPDKKDDLLFGKPTVPYFDSSAVVQPRARKYVLVGDKVRQSGAVLEDEEKAAFIASRTETPNLMRTAHGQGEVYRTTVFAKLLCLALVKFATLDPLGMGIEMEAGKPGWYDALNGLPGLFGSSVAETYELERLLTLLLATMAGKEDQTVELPEEQMRLLREVVQALEAWQHSVNADRDYVYWDAVATARETYRQRVRLGFDGQIALLAFGELMPILAAFRAKVQAGIQRALAINDGVPPTYFAFTVTDYELINDAEESLQCDERGHSFIRAKRFEPSVLPLFLEGPVHAMKVQPDVASARRLHAQVRASDLFDRKLKMYKVNAPLADQSHEIGRARAFTPGWLENESIWVHMEYKYLLEVLRAQLYEEFFQDLKEVLVPFQDPKVYGRSTLENCSFIVSSAHPDESLHGAGFVARLTGATAEFLSMWSVMMAGERPFFVQDGQLYLALRPRLPGWLFTEDGEITFRFLGSTHVTYHNPARLDTFGGAVKPQRIVLRTDTKHGVDLPGDVVGPPYAAMVRDGQIASIDVYF
jgi:hypothetical protein